MTLIQSFSDSHIDNLLACLRLHPEKLIFLGNAEDASLPLERYRKLLLHRGLTPEICLQDVTGKDFREICTLLETLTGKEADCVIDLTGGQEPVILAVGAVLASGRPLRVQKYDHSQRSVLDCVHNNRCLSCGSGPAGTNSIRARAYRRGGGVQCSRRTCSSR